VLPLETSSYVGFAFVPPACPDVVAMTPLLVERLLHARRGHRRGSVAVARLQADQAEADTRVARANAEGRRAMAVAQEQERIAGIGKGIGILSGRMPHGAAEALGRPARDPPYTGRLRPR
jgi:hypothetical protein